jgi:hypothetical protein
MATDTYEGDTRVMTKAERIAFGQVLLVVTTRGVDVAIMEVEHLANVWDLMSREHERRGMHREADMFYRGAEALDSAMGSFALLSE